VTDAALLSEQVVAETELERLSIEAVSLLGIRTAIDRTAILFRQIEECDAKSSDDALFIATSLPIANAFIHHATSRHGLAEARKWARVLWPDEDDPTSMLAALTLLYIVCEGVRRFREDPARKQVWARIRGRVANTLHGVSRSPATAVA
jgi:hypothetical protein